LKIAASETKCEKLQLEKDEMKKLLSSKDQELYEMN